MAILTLPPIHPPRRAPGRWHRVVLLLGLIWSPAASARAQEAATGEYQIKAVFLFNFAQFVQWPQTAFATDESPIVIGVLGEDPFASALDDTVRGERVNQRPLLVRRFRHVHEITDCHILFISRSENARLGEILLGLRNRSILTVGDIDGFSQRGGMIRFVTENKKLRLRINLEAAKAAHLTISSQLLRPADIVRPGKG